MTNQSSAKQSSLGKRHVSSVNERPHQYTGMDGSRMRKPSKNSSMMQ